MSVVLLLDDRPDDRDLMTTVLGYGGYNVVEAGDGAAALALTRERRPDLIIADIVMPGMNGYEFVRHLRSDPQVATTPVIFCTANYLEPEVRELAASCGVFKFISKPSSPEAILATVAEELGAPGPRPAPVTPGPEFEREQLRVINDKLVEKVAELERVSAHRRHLLGLVMQAQEDERRRIADDVHDDSLQCVHAIGLRLAALRQWVSDPDAIEALDRLQETVQLASSRLRSLLFELRPLELRQHGLAAALASYLEHIQRDEGLAFTLDDLLHSHPDAQTSAFLYRLTKEVLMNVRKHSQASSVLVTLLTREGNHVVRVHDDGIGFDPGDALLPRPGHLGLAALAERLELAGGALRIESAIGEGSTVELAVPAGRRRVTDLTETALG